MNASDKRAAGTARRRRVAVAGLLAVAMGAAVAFTGAQALATGGSGAVSTYMARGPVSQSVVIGTPKTVTATKTVRVRVKGKVVTRKVSFTYQTVTPMMTCGTSTACDTAYQQLTIPPGGFTGWHTHPGPTFVAGRKAKERSTTGCRAARRSSTRRAQASCSPRLRFTTCETRGSAPLVLWAFYALPPGTTNAAIRIDQPQPAECPNIP